MILALETATNVCSVVYEDRENNAYEKRTVEHGSHSEQLFLFIEELMEEHDFSISELEAVLISEGPGSYTGLRIAASAVKGLLFQEEVPLYGINTLASFAMQAIKEEPGATTIHSIIDARRKHFYYRPFQVRDGKLEATGAVQVIPIKEFEPLIKEEDIIIGTGRDRMNPPVRSKAKTFGVSSITAKSLIDIYRAGDRFFYKADPESFSPTYYTSSQIQ